MHIQLDITPLQTWLPESHPLLVIAGPCSAETEQQVLQTAETLAQTGKVQVFRAGLWKPRTRPHSFEGVGETGLSWLQQVKNIIGLKVATEVATAQHIEACLKHEIDMVWIGARTSVNPFAIQAIADALQGVDIPVLVKNPINADLHAWLGALERINQAGITKLGAICRGASSVEEAPFRNVPRWETAIALKTACPPLPILCDPSHIAGNQSLIPSIAQKALDLAMDGLMIESHSQPHRALTDAQQQVTPKQLATMLHNLLMQTCPSHNQPFRRHEEGISSVIDTLDEKIIQQLGKRMQLAKKLTTQQASNNLTSSQKQQGDSMLHQKDSLAANTGLSKAFIKQLLTLMHQELTRKQDEYISEKN